MIYIEICYDHQSFDSARTAIVSIPEKEGIIHIVEYFNHAKRRLLNYLAKEYHIDEDTVFVHDWKYYGNAFDIIL